MTSDQTFQNFPKRQMISEALSGDIFSHSRTNDMDDNPKAHNISPRVSTGTAVYDDYVSVAQKNLQHSLTTMDSTGTIIMDEILDTEQPQPTKNYISQQALILLNAIVNFVAVVIFDVLLAYLKLTRQYGTSKR